MTLAALIDKQDTAEQVRDQVAAILAAETASQVALAQNQSHPDPSAWEFRVFKERANPWERLSGGNDSPIVNVWWDTSTFEPAASSVVDRQQASAVLNIDCYAYGASEADGAGGHTPGDLAAALAAQSVCRLVRNILMAAEYTYLGMRGLVGRRWIESITNLQPQQDNQNVHHVTAARVALRVTLNEYSPQVEAEALGFLAIDVRHTDEGQVVLQAHYDYENEDF